MTASQVRMDASGVARQVSSTVKGRMENNMKVAIAILSSLMILTCVNVNAEIEKMGVPCKEKLCLLYWPKLASVKGWHHDREASEAYGMNAQVPEGFTFADAKTVIYARALYKPGIPETTSLDMLIQDDRKEFLARDPEMTIAEVPPLKTADGQSLRSFTFSSKKEGNWEQVSYGEEGDYYLVFTVSSRTKGGFKEALGSYGKFITSYKEKP